MSTLRFPYKASLESRVRQYNLRRVDVRRTTNGTQLVICNPEFIHQGHSDVFRASMKVGRDAPLDVVCKIRCENFDRMRREARTYKRLEKCQGNSIPQFSCLVLEYCGVPFEGTLLHASWTFKFHLMACLLDIHDNGSQHNDITERSVVVRPDGRPCIVDLHWASEHICTCDRPTDINFHDVVPSIRDFVCTEIHDVADMMLLWRRRIVLYLTSRVDSKWAETPELLATQAPKGVSYDRALIVARHVVDEHRKRLAFRASLPFE
ncbi:hypothetical protein B0H21DRAFT_757004 [Amylocystis lapponica]|nr:hypothetical protein B0H21DRAFT_757004 [Amylocystis lapponica]